LPSARCQSAVPAVCRRQIYATDRAVTTNCLTNLWFVSTAVCRGSRWILSWVMCRWPDVRCIAGGPQQTAISFSWDDRSVLGRKLRAENWTPDLPNKKYKYVRYTITTTSSTKHTCQFSTTRIKVDGIDLRFHDIQYGKALFRFLCFFPIQYSMLYNFNVQSGKKSLCAPDDYGTSTQFIRTIPTQLMIWRWQSQNTFRICTVLYCTRSPRTQFGVSINVRRLAGDTLNITCNFLYCNHQVHRDFLTLVVC
jgi:hypothetical protein